MRPEIVITCQVAVNNKPFSLQQRDYKYDKNILKCKQKYFLFMSIIRITVIPWNVMILNRVVSVNHCWGVSAKKFYYNRTQTYTCTDDILKRDLFGQGLGLICDQILNVSYKTTIFNWVMISFPFSEIVFWDWGWEGWKQMAQILTNKGA